jgi:hypothetical protein
MAKTIGPTFPSELEAAGLLGLPFSWGADGTLNWGDAMTTQHKNAVLAVYAAHDPTKTSPPSTNTSITMAQLQAALTSLNGVVGPQQVQAAISAAVAAAPDSAA